MAKREPNKRYTAEFKQHIIETMLEEKLSYRETARQLPDHTSFYTQKKFFLPLSCTAPQSPT